MVQDERKKVAVAIPLYIQVPSVFLKGLITFLPTAGKKYNINLITIDSTIIDVARNVLVENFLNTDAEYLFFLDSDIVFPPDIIDKLIKHDKDVASALYFTRKLSRPNYRFFKDGNYYSTSSVEPNKLLSVDALGLGCMLIKRNVIETLAEKEKDKPLFKVDYKTRTDSLGEDTYFCSLVKKYGFEIFVDTSVLVGHYGGIIPEQSFKKFLY